MFTSRFPKAKIGIVDSENNDDDESDSERVSIEFPCKKRTFAMIEQSIDDLRGILKGSDTKIVVFETREIMDSVELYMSAELRLFNISNNRKGLYLKYITQMYRNYFAVESDVRGLNFHFDKWIFFNVTTDVSTKLRTTGENIIFFNKNQNSQ